ncbi:iron-containing alcohol dehydrogenase [Brevundimonas denitrificans]|uniref:iron-containing alcohol dehydrogenase n=1 Tax=Brevundimonas denitrificans TaxID=1443434 RepID=UPI00223C5331|nr:iron-containing alcohol dehydrogenase [Brevundimonas denitrificans]
MTGFSFETTPRILCEDGAALKLAEFLNGMGVTRPFIVTDAGLVGAGVVRPILDALNAAGVTAAVFSDVLADPPEASVMAAVAAARDAGADGVVGLGGGSSLDTAKLVALLAGTDQALPDIYGIGLARGPRLPLVQVPTTAGTGSEVTNIAIVTTPDDQKKGVVSPLLYPDAAILDATLTTGLPPRVTAMTGVDAMVHAIEAYTSRHKKNPVSDSLAVAALKLLHANIRRVIADGSDLPARRAMLQGSLLAGMAFANAPGRRRPRPGLSHRGHLPRAPRPVHALVLGPVLRFNLPAAGPLYAELAAAIGLQPDAAAFVDEIAALTAEMPMEQRLSELGSRSSIWIVWPTTPCRCSGC